MLPLRWGGGFVIKTDSRKYRSFASEHLCPKAMKVWLLVWFITLSWSLEAGECEAGMVLRGKNFTFSKCSALSFSQGDDIEKQHEYDWYTTSHLLLGAAKLFKAFRKINLYPTEVLFNKWILQGERSFTAVFSLRVETEPERERKGSCFSVWSQEAFPESPGRGKFVFQCKTRHCL